MPRRSAIPQLLLSFLMIAVLGCVPTNSATSLPTSPTVVRLPVSTETAVVIATIDVLPTTSPTASPTEMTATRKVALTFTKNAFCRKGPGAQYFDIGSFNQGDTAQAEGRNDTEPRWWYMLMSNGDHCWVSDTTVQPDTEAEDLPVQLPQKSLPQTPPDVYADRVCKKGGFAVTLNWTASSTAEGYYVYLNGEMIQDIGRGTQTSYVIKLPMNQPVSYALEAYNNVGTGEPISIEDPGCP